MKKLLCLFCFVFLPGAVFCQKLLTPFEKSTQTQSATYSETVSFYNTLKKQFRNISLKYFNTTDAGLPLQLVLFSADSQFDPKLWHQQGKIVILINNGIHAGEPDGIDASMMLLRDLAGGKIKTPLNVVLAVIPVYNIGGALNRNRSSRVNQNGPEEYGFRGNAQNLDLNRDFTKNDSKNARAFAEIFHYIDPDIFIDNHVSDGADFQHVMTLLTTQYNKLGEPLASLLHNNFEPSIFKAMKAKNFAMTPYVNFEEGSPEKGWGAFFDSPRYSSGYTTLFQTLGFTPETHMLKPFRQRVQSTYALMQSIIEESSKMAASIKAEKAKMIEQVKSQKDFVLAWKADTSYFEMVSFEGYRASEMKSEVTGLPRLYYDHNKPFKQDVKYYNRFVPEWQVTAPTYYIIPQGWWTVLELLQLNHVKIDRFARDTTIEVEAYRIEQYKSLQKSYEKHHKNYNITTSTTRQKQFFRKGDYVIRCNQRANRYLVEMLEPTGDDSFFAWNFFDAILQQKEGYSDYRWEDVAAVFLKTNPEVRKKLEDKKKLEPEFAASSSAQLNFVYKLSPYYEPAHMMYPVYRWNP